ncbi:MAG: Hsp70 family protein [Magnetococcales bacterium]|nr:Hsp70 family protein [Magnetococcales bacterium]
MTETIIGIDLGTTNSEVAVFQDGQTRVLANAAGEHILPSFVGLADDGALLVGQPARNQYVVHPERTVKSIKRRMGETCRITMGGESYTPQEISAMILRRLREMAEEALGHPVQKAVITIPAYFSDVQRQATREAGEIAGLEVVRIIQEPTAAALAYEAGHQGSRRILVYDLGGGTFDVSVVRIENDVVEVISSHGNNHLGGDDFDQKIVDHLVTHLQREQGVDVSTNPLAMARLQRSAEACKRQLSDHPYATIEEEYLTELVGKPVHLAMELSRQEYETMITPFIEETLAAVHTALNGASLTASAMDEVLLVGGATRTPLVRERLMKVFGLIPRSEIDPDLCVAMGAAIQGAVIGGEKAAAILVDVTPYTFGIGVVGELDGYWRPHVFSPIIRKNTPVPVSRSEVYATVQDGQESVEIEIYQGEHPDALQNIKIGNFQIEGLSDVDAGNEIILQLDLDLDGILRVTAREKRTGLEKRITIENAMAKRSEAHLSEARSRVAALFGDDIAQTGQPASSSSPPHLQEIVQAKTLIKKAERLLEQATPDDREEMINLIEAIQDALAAADIASVKRSSEPLAEILFYLES